jgi:3-oxoacyl-[acyl-carrier-protein] synthase-1
MHEIVIIGSGLVTALGLGVTANSVHIRAGIAAFEESDFLDAELRRIVAAGLPEAVIMPWAAGETHGLAPRSLEIVRMAGMAVGEALAPLAELLGENSIPAWAAWPEHETNVALDIHRLAQAVAIQAGGRIAIWGNHRGRAGGIEALASAQCALERGAPFALVVGMDSFLHAHVLGTLLQAGRIKTPQQADGLIPSMGAGALVLARADVAERMLCRVLARIGGIGTALEAGHFGNDGEWQGNALAAAAQQALAEAPAAIAELWSGMTGERCWAGEFGVTQIRCQPQVPATATIRHPAEFWGDLGAAASVAMACVAIAGYQRGWVRLPALLLASSDFGQRGALVVCAP